MTKEQYNEWRNHPATLFFRQFLKDKSEYLKAYCLQQWVDGNGRLSNINDTIRGQIIELIDISDVPFEIIEAFYHERKDGAEIS